MIVDTHCHLNDEAFDEDRAEVIKNLQSNNIKSAFVVGTNLKYSQFALQLAQNYNNLYAIIGMYPEYASEYDDQFEAFLDSNLDNPKVVAVGEIGLDFHTEGFDALAQQRVFARQIQLAGKHNLPLSIHTREAFEKTLDTLKQNKQYLHGGVIHCFSGSPEVAREFIKLGFKLGIGGVCTFKNAKKVVNTIKDVDPQYLLLETDSPYLAPVPHRGERNEPKFTNLVLDKIAEIKGLDRAELEKIILQNTQNTFAKYK
jgi:TatD DNase family protein